MGTTFGRPLSEKIAESINGNDLCNNLPSISKAIGATVDYTFYNGHGGLLITDELGEQFVVISAPKGLRAADPQCYNRSTGDAILQAFGLEPTLPTLPNIPQSQVAMVRPYQSTNMGIGAIRRHMLL
jgi:hypothetical protein